MTLADWTQVIILGSALLWIGWDAYVYVKRGNLPTESWTIKKWSFYVPGIAFLLGLLMGHLFFTFSTPERLCQPDPIAQPAK